MYDINGSHVGWSAEKVDAEVAFKALLDHLGLTLQIERSVSAPDKYMFKEAL